MNTLRKPPWLKKKIVFDASRTTSALMNELGLNTVCREAACPNMSECFKGRHATFLILGKACTRRCAFCNVESSNPQPLDEGEPPRIAEAVRRLGLRHVVVTSVTRDDLPDKGASHFAKTVQELKKLPVSVELLIPDLGGDRDAIRTVAQSSPDIIGHNMETAPRLYHLRPGADYKRSLAVLKTVKEIAPEIPTKSGLMLGLGENETEVWKVMEDLRAVSCDFLALGQYLRPGLKNARVRAFIPPEKFLDYKSQALALGFKHVEAGPYVRSSYNAGLYLSNNS